MSASQMLYVHFTSGLVSAPPPNSRQLVIWHGSGNSAGNDGMSHAPAPCYITAFDRRVEEPCLLLMCKIFGYLGPRGESVYP